MELRHLRYFIAVALEENVSRAALKLHVSQPALSRQIRDLEDELGFLLLERTAKSVKLTEAGSFFLKEAQAVLAQVQDAVKRSKAVATGEKAEIHVGYAPSLTVQILPKTLRAFQKQFPKVRVTLHDLSTEEMLTRLRSGSLHVALVVQTSRAMLRGLRFEELARYPLCVALPPHHSFARRKTLALEDVIKEPLVVYNRKDYPEYHETLATLFASTKGTLNIAEEHDGVTSLAAAVESGHGIALVPSCLTAIVGARLKLIPLKPQAGLAIVGAAWKPESSSPFLEAFIKATRPSS